MSGRQRPRCGTGHDRAPGSPRHRPAARSAPGGPEAVRTLTLVGEERAAVHALSAACARAGENGLRLTAPAAHAADGSGELRGARRVFRQFDARGPAGTAGRLACNRCLHLGPADSEHIPETLLSALLRHVRPPGHSPQPSGNPAAVPFSASDSARSAPLQLAPQLTDARRTGIIHRHRAESHASFVEPLVSEVVVHQAAPGNAVD